MAVFSESAEQLQNAEFNLRRKSNPIDRERAKIAKRDADIAEKQATAAFAEADSREAEANRAIDSRNAKQAEEQEKLRAFAIKSLESIANTGKETLATLTDSTSTPGNQMETDEKEQTEKAFIRVQTSKPTSSSRTQQSAKASTMPSSYERTNRVITEEIGSQISELNIKLATLNNLAAQAGISDDELLAMYRAMVNSLRKNGASPVSALDNLSSNIAWRLAYELHFLH